MKLYQVVSRLLPLLFVAGLSSLATATPLAPLTAPVTFHGLAKEFNTVPGCGTDVTGATLADAIHITLTLNADQSMTLLVQDNTLSTMYSVSGSWYQSPVGAANLVKMQWDGQLSQVAAGTTGSWATFLTDLNAESLNFCQTLTATAGATSVAIQPASVRMDENVLILNKTETGGLMQLFIHGVALNDAKSPGTPVGGLFRYKLTALLGP